MPLTITGDLITSVRTAHTARLLRGRPHAGHMTRLPGRLLDRGSAVAMLLVDVTSSGPRPGHGIWPHIGNQAVELGRTAPQAITTATRSPDAASGREPALSPAGREAVGP